MAEAARFLKFGDFSKPIKITYRLSDDLLTRPEYVKDVQALTLNPDRPLMGLKGSKGLFGSDEWWGNIENGQIPTLQISGIIQRAYFSGQDSKGANNTIDILQENGMVSPVGIYTQQPKDVKLFQVGKYVWIIYARDEMKDQSGNKFEKYSNTALEMAVEVAVHPSQQN